MRSRASFKSHPLHAALIPFPFAFLAGALIFDVAAALGGRPQWALTASHLAAAGVVAALVAAIPGFIDYFASVPPRSTAKTRATRHLLVNLSAVALFAIGWLLRRPQPAEPGAVVLALELGGLALLVAGGWMGGTLVYRNQIGVDHRYAGAGKWSEQRIEAKPGVPVRVAAADELEVHQLKLLHVGGRRIVLGRTEHGWTAFDDACTHRGASLADGAVVCGVVHCPWHGSQFDIATGERRAGPAESSLGVYRVEESEGEVRLVL